MSINPQQRALLKKILAVGRQQGASPKELKAAVETAIVESNISNPQGGDADSGGWRQERRSIYPDPTNVTASAKRFFQETHAAKDRYGTAGALAAAVQRPAAQYAGRYQDHSSDAASILQGLRGSLSTSTTSRPAASTQTTATPGDDGMQRRQLLAQYLLQRDSPSALPELEAGLSALKTQAPSSATKLQKITPTAAGSSGSGATAVGFATSRLGHYAENEGSNLGGELNTLQARFGLKGQAWCAMFATTAVAHGGAARSVRTPSVADINTWAQQGTHGYEKGLLHTSQARAGDLITFGNDHVGVVVSVDRDGTVHSIEGNTSGEGVQKRTHPAGSGMIARPKYKAAS